MALAVKKFLRAGPVAVSLGLLIALGGCGGCSGRAERGPKAFTLGAIFSLTGASLIGPPQANGARLAVAQINAAGGVDGVPVRLLISDSGSSPARAAAQMRNLILGSHAIAVLGPSLSDSALVSHRVANRLRTPVLAVSNVGDGIVGRCAEPCWWTWRDSLSARATVPANVEAYLASERPTAVGILNTKNDLLAAEQARLAVRSFRAAGVPIAAHVSFAANPHAVDPAVARVRAARPRALFVASSAGRILAEMIKQARAQGFRGAILGGNLINSAVTARLAGSAGEGAQGAAAWWAGSDFSANRRFVASYRRAYGEMPDQFAAQAYTGVRILAQALERAGLARSALSVERQRVKVQSALGDVALTAPLGPFRFSADHDVKQIVWIVQLDGRGGSRLVDFCNPRCGGGT
jgi:branched-chain amino acid transport system substrate-binding protein